MLLGAGLVFGCIVAVAVVFSAYKALGTSDFFQITTIRIEGCESVGKQEILELSGVDIHSNLFALDGDAVRTKVESGPWIRHAEIAKHWPNRLDITVKEYTPVALVNLEGVLHYADLSGNVFAEALPPGDMDYPVITGIAGTEAGDTSGDNLLRQAIRFMKYASAGNLNLPVQNISEINVSDTGDAILFLVDRPFPIHLGRMGEGLKTKYSRLVRVLSWLYRQKKFAATEYIRIGELNEKIIVGQKSL